MKELVEQIAAAYEAFAKDATAQAENGNKATRQLVLVRHHLKLRRR